MGAGNGGIMSNLKLIEVIAGTEYQVQQSSEASAYVLTHNRCGNRFVRSEADISLHGIHCPRCEGSSYLRDQVVDGVNEKLASTICKQCKEVLPTNALIIGDTSNTSNTITVKCDNGQSADIVIQDLLDGRNLPDWLQRRVLNTVNVPLQVLDFFVPPRYTVLDNFDKLDDCIRVKDNVLLQVKAATVQDFIEDITNESHS